MAVGDSTLDWIRWRDQVLESARLVVIKVGSAVLTSEQGLDLRVVNRLADQIAAADDVSPATPGHSAVEDDTALRAQRTGLGRTVDLDGALGLDQI